MMYPFMTIYPTEEPRDVTEITFSDIEDGRITVYFERWNVKRDAFDSMWCYLPNGSMEEVTGFTAEEAEWHHEKIINIQEMLLETAQEYMEETQYAANA